MYRGKGGGGGAFSLTKGMMDSLKREKKGGGDDPEWFGAVKRSIHDSNLVLRGCEGSEGTDWLQAPEMRLGRQAGAYNLGADAMTFVAWKNHLRASICFSRVSGSNEMLLIRDAATGGADVYHCAHGATFRKAGGIGPAAQLVTRFILAEHPPDDHEMSCADLVIAVLTNLHLHV